MALSFASLPPKALSLTFVVHTLTQIAMTAIKSKQLFQIHLKHFGAIGEHFLPYAI